MLKLVRQPIGSSLCGQACVAMVAGVTLDESIKLFNGRKGGTTGTDLIDALRKAKIKTTDKVLLTKSQPKTKTAIVRLRFEKSKISHWTVYHNGIFYDPDIGMIKNYPQGVRETSFLPIDNPVIF